MNLLFQHTHQADEIAGVLTYINVIEPELQSRDIVTQRVSTKTDSVWQQIRSILWADIVHMNSNHLMFALLCKLFGKKVILKYHYPFYTSTHSTYEPMSFRQRLKTELIHYIPKSNYPLKWKLHSLIKYIRLLTRLLTAALVDRRLACSQFLADSYSLPWPVDLAYNPALLHDGAIQKRLEQLTQPYTFVYVGRLQPDKGVDILLQSTKILNDQGDLFQVLIVGDGSASSPLKSLVEELQISDRVTFLGRRSHSESLTLMQSALALVTPSRWQEPAGYVSCEASTVQTCSIVARVGGLPEIATPYGLLFEQEDSAGLAIAMKACLDDPQGAIDRGHNAYQYVLEQFPPYKIANQLLAICDEFYRDKF
jgi:glycogen synthase